MNEILKAEKLTKTYGKSAVVNGVSLTGRQGDIYGLIRKNGATRLRSCVWFWDLLRLMRATWSFSVM